MELVQFVTLLLSVQDVLASDTTETLVRLFVWVLGLRGYVLFIGFFIWISMRYFQCDPDEEQTTAAGGAVRAGGATCSHGQPCGQAGQPANNQPASLRIQLATHLLGENQTDGPSQKRLHQKTGTETGETRSWHAGAKNIAPLRGSYDETRTRLNRSLSPQTVYVGKLVQIQSSNQIQVGDCCMQECRVPIEQPILGDAICAQCQQNIESNSDSGQASNSSLDTYDELNEVTSCLAQTDTGAHTEPVSDRDQLFVEARLKILTLTQERREYLNQQVFERSAKGGVRASLQKILKWTKEGSNHNR